MPEKIDLDALVAEKRQRSHQLLMDTIMDNLSPDAVHEIARRMDNRPAIVRSDSVEKQITWFANRLRALLDYPDETDIIWKR